MTQGRRFALYCDRAGCIREVLRDDFQAFGNDVNGLPVAQLVSAHSMERYFAMLAQLQSESVVYGWEIEFESEQGRQSLHLAGALGENEILLIASEERNDVTRLNDELIKLNNHQVNRLREMIRAHSRRRPSADAAVLDDLSAVGNELAAAHRRLAKQEMEMERLLEQRNTMMGMLVHDLRTPLTVVVGVSSLLLADNLRPNQRSLIESIQTAAEAMAHLVNETMDWTQLKSATVKLSLRPHDVNQLIDEVLGVSRFLADRKKLKISHQSSHAVGPVLVDGPRIKQVLQNVIGNAVKFSPSGGVINVAVSAQAEIVTVAIEDAGPGIDEESLKSVFEPFVHSPGGSDAGYGLGLAIARGIMDLHNAEIEIESAVGKGTRVFLRLPKA